MNLRKAIKSAIVVAGVAAPMMASAAGHQDTTGWFDDWTMDTNGSIQITGAATLGNAAVTPTVGEGFLQRSVEFNGKTYIQTIIADVPGTIAASLDPNNAADLMSMGFTDESVVRMGSGNSNGGIASRQNFSSMDAAMGMMAPEDGYFTSSTELNTGTEFMNMMNMAASGGAAPMVRINQAVWNEVAAGDGLVGTADDTFDTQFSFVHGMNMMGNKWALTNVSQNVELDAGGSNQTFAFDGAENLQEDGTGTITSILGSAGSVEFNLGDNVARVNVGQTLAGLGDFGYGRFGNESTALEVNGYNFLDMTTPTVVFSETAAETATPDGSNDPFDGGMFVN